MYSSAGLLISRPSSSAGGGQASGGSLDDLYGNQPHPLGPPPPPPMYHHEEHPPSPWSNPAVLVPTSLAAGLGLGVAAVQAYRNLWPPQAPEHMVGYTINLFGQYLGHTLHLPILASSYILSLEYHASS